MVPRLHLTSTREEEVPAIKGTSRNGEVECRPDGFSFGRRLLVYRGAPNCSVFPPRVTSNVV